MSYGEVQWLRQSFSSESFLHYAIIYIDITLAQSPTELGYFFIVFPPDLQEKYYAIFIFIRFLYSSS